MQSFTAPPQQPGNPQQGYSAQTHGQPQMGPRKGCFSFNQGTKPQGYAIGTAGLIFMSGGMNIAWSVGFRGEIVYSWSKHNIKAWFLGVIIGAVITCGLANKVPKKWVLLFASLLVTIGGLVNACTHHYGSGTIAACYLDGIANGLVFAPFMALAAELAGAYKWGIYASSMEQLSFGIGILLQIVNDCSYDPFSSSSRPENMKGELSTILGFLALILGSFVTIESPVLLPANSGEPGAIDALRRLPAVLTEETNDQLAKHKSLTLGQSIGQALPTFLRLGYLRVLNAMSLSAFVEYTLFCSSLDILVSSDCYIDFAMFRFLGSVFSIFCSDWLGRKKLTLLGLLVSAVMVFAIPGHYGNKMGNVVVLLQLFAFFAGVAFTPSSAYISEAYPLGVKQQFISFTFVVEMFVFLIFQGCHYSYAQETFNYFYLMGAMYLVGFILACISFPETRPLTIRGAQDQFRRFLPRAFN